MSHPSHLQSRWTLLLDGAFLAVVGTAALIAETAGHFLGVGPLAASKGSPHTIGGFEAHGLAIIIGALLLHAAGHPHPRMWHVAAMFVHLLLGGANILFWDSFVHNDMVRVGTVTTGFHVIFVLAEAACIGGSGREPVATGNLFRRDGRRA